MSLNMLILILMLTLKSIKMKETALNSSIPPTTNLKTNFTKYLKKDYPLHLQLFWRESTVSGMSIVRYSRDFHDELCRWQE